MATAAQRAQFQTATRSLTDFAVRDLLELWRPLVERSTPERAREVLLSVMPDLVASYGETAAVLGADWYDLLRADVMRGPSVSVLGSVPTVEQVQATTRWAVGPLWDGSPDSAYAQLAGALQRLVMDSLRDSIDKSARLDARSGKVAAVSWSRHTRPQLAESKRSCDFCRMLEGRGPVYRSAAAAGLVVGRGSDRTGVDEFGNRQSGGIGQGLRARGEQAIAASFHDDCNCISEPTFYSAETVPVTVRDYTTPTRVLMPLGATA